MRIAINYTPLLWLMIATAANPLGLQRRTVHAVKQQLRGILNFEFEPVILIKSYDDFFQGSIAQN